MNTETTAAAPVKAPKAAPKKAPDPKAPARKFTKKEEGRIADIMGESKCTRARAIKAMDDAAAHAAKLAPKPDPAPAKLDADLVRSKEHLAAKPATPKAPAKPAPKKKAQAEEGRATYTQLAQRSSGPSTVDRPVQVMWNLCDGMKDSRRKDVIAKAVEMGVGYYTARTQYQLWLTAYRNS